MNNTITVSDSLLPKPGSLEHFHPGTYSPVMVRGKSLNKVAIYVDSLQGYGADKILLKIANGLSDKGILVDLVVSKKLNQTGLKIHPLVNQISFDSSRFNPLKNVFCLANYLKAEKPDILFSSIHFNNIVAACALILSGVKSKLITRQANTLQHQLKGYPFAIGALMYPLIRLAYSKSHLVIGPSKGMLSDLKGFMKVADRKIATIYNPTVTSDIFEKAQQPTHHPWFDRKTAPIILGAGRLKPQKDFVTLIHAFAEVKKTLKDAKLVILGEGPQRQKLEKLATELGVKEDVDLVGFTENPYAFIAMADVFALSSTYEGLPNILIEALALGKKIVATNCHNGPAEILKYGQYGRLVPVGSPEPMAEALVAALEEPYASLREPQSIEDFQQASQVEKYITTFLAQFPR